MALPRLEVGIDCLDPYRLASFWSIALGYEIGDLDQAGVYLDLVPPDEHLPVVYFQRVPEPKTIKNRLHLDLYIEDPERLIDTLLGLGGHLIGSDQTGTEGGWWQVVVDPEGNEFCVCRET